MFGFGADKAQPETRAVPVELGYLGKLRSRADYIKHAAESREVGSLDACMKDWLVMQAAQRNDAAVPPRSLGFLMAGGHDRQSLCGYIFPSEDSHGRRYPFYYFARWSDVDLYFKPAPVFYGSWQLFQSGDESLGWPSACPSEETVAALREESLVRRRPSGKRMMSDSMACMADLTLERWLSHLVGGDPQMQVRMLAGCRALIEQYLKQLSARRTPTDLCLPLGLPELAPYSLLFWLHLLSGMDRSRLWRPDIVWTLGDSMAQLYVLAQPMTASRLQPLFDANAPKGGNDWTSADGEPHLAWAGQILQQADSLLLDIAIRWSQIG